MRVCAQPAMKIGTQMAQMAQISQIQSVFLFIRVYNLFSSQGGTPISNLWNFHAKQMMRGAVENGQ